jgi:hypothetical protein
VLSALLLFDLVGFVLSVLLLFDLLALCFLSFFYLFRRRTDNTMPKDQIEEGQTIQSPKDQIEEGQTTQCQKIK